MTETSQTSLAIASLCKMGWCYQDSCFWAEEIDAAVPANKLPQLRADIERIPSVARRRLAFLAALGVKPTLLLA